MLDGNPSSGLPGVARPTAGFPSGGTGRATWCPDRANRGGAMNRPFADRHEAGRVLAERSAANSRAAPTSIVLGLPRGGVPVAYEVARALGVPFDVFLVRKLGAPGQEELAMGAIASGGVVVINDEVVDGLRIPWEPGRGEIARERMELTRREVLYRGDRRPLEVSGRIVILVDDGLATGSTMRAARAGPAAEAAGADHRRRSHRGTIDLPRNSRPSPMPASARSRPNRSGPSASGTRTSSRSATRKCVDLLARSAEDSGTADRRSAARTCEP